MRTIVSGAGGVLAAFLGSLCCVGPLLLVTVGVGAGLASALEPFRPLFGGIMLVCLALGYWAVYGRRLIAVRSARAAPDSETARPPEECALDGRGVGAACAASPRRSRDAVILWCATALAAVLWTFPTWSLWLL